MKNFEHYFRNPRPYADKKSCLIKSIRRHYEIYSRKNISISKCLSTSGALTAGFIAYNNIYVNIPKTTYDTIVIVAINYYAMLYMDMFSGYYTVNRQHTYLQVYSLAEGYKELLAVSLYEILLTGNRHESVDREQIGIIIRDLHSKKLLDGSFSQIDSDS